MAQQPGGHWGPAPPGTPAMNRQTFPTPLDSSSTAASSNSNITTLQQAYSGLPAGSSVLSPRPPGTAPHGHPRSNVAIQRFAAALDAAGLADPVVRALAMKHTANSSGNASNAREAFSGIPGSSSSSSGRFSHSARQHFSYPAANPESLRHVAREVQEFASAVSAAGLANPTFMTIAAMSPDAAASASTSTSTAASPRAPTSTPMLHTASSNTSSTMRPMGSSQLTGISAAGIVAPLRSSDYGTRHGDYTADHSNISSLAGEAIGPVSWGRHKWSKAAAAPGVAATAEEPWEEGPVGEPAAADEDDPAAGEPQFWLSPLPERQQQQGDYSRSSARSSLSASTAADGMQPVLQEGLSKWPSSVCPADYAYAQSRQGSESRAAADETPYGHQQQQVTEAAAAAAAAAQWWQQQQQHERQQQQVPARVKDLLNVEEASEQDSEEQQQPRQGEVENRSSAAGAAVAAAGAAATAAFGGLKNMLALAGRRSNLGRQAESAQLPVEDTSGGRKQLPVEDASSSKHAGSTDRPAATAQAGSTQQAQQQQQQQQQDGVGVATRTGSGMRHRISWGVAAAAALAGRGSSNGGPASRRVSTGSAAGCCRGVASTAGMASTASDDADASSCSSSTKSSAASDASDGRAHPSHSPGGLATLFCCGLRPATAAPRSTDRGSNRGKHGTASQGSSRQGAGKHKRTSLLLLLTALVLLAACGMGAGVYFGIVRQTKQQRARAAEAAEAAAAAALAVGGTAGAAAVAAPVTSMNFQVVLAVPAVSADQGCRTWFNSDERLDTYKSIFAASYTAALQQQVPQSSINSITCGGNEIYKVVYTSGNSNVTTALPPQTAAAATGPATSTGSSVAAESTSSRHLLEDPSTPHAPGTRSLTLTFVRQSPLALVEVVTRFKLPAPTSHADRARIAEVVVTGSSAILSGPMSEFFKVPSALMNFVPWSSNTEPLESGVQPLSTPPTIVPSMSYAAAPTCLFPLTQRNSMSDDYGRLWSMMGGKECVFRPAAAAIPKPVIAWSDAPACDDEATENNSVVDASGRLWGWQDDASCAFKRSDNALPSSGIGSASRLSASSWSDVPGRVSVVWEAAASCSFSPTRANAMPDTHGRLWGWENGTSCVFRWQSLPN